MTKNDSTNHFKNFSVQRTARKKYQILEKLTLF